MIPNRKTITNMCITLSVLASGGCTTAHVDSSANGRLEGISQPLGQFCEFRAKPKLKGGGMYQLSGGDIQFIGNCRHATLKASDTVLIYFGDAKEDLSEDLNAFLNPSAYYSQDEIAELDCSPGSQCELLKETKKQRAQAEEQRVPTVEQPAAGVEQPAATVEQPVAGEEPQRKESVRQSELTINKAKTTAVVHFDTNSIEPKDKVSIKKLAERMAGKHALVVIGHADSVGSDNFNEKLSVRRAKRVKELLVANGVDAKIVQISGKGEKEPIADNITADGRALNRRAIVQGEDYVDGN